MNSKHLSPSMRRAVNILHRDGYIGMEDVAPNTAVALMARGIVREQTPLSKGAWAGRHYPVTTREQGHSLAWIEALERLWAAGEWPHWTEESFQRFLQHLRAEWSV